MSAIFCLFNLGLQLDDSVGIVLVRADKNLNEVDEGKNSSDTAKEGEDNSSDTLLGLAHIEVVDTDSAEEEAKKNSTEGFLKQIKELLEQQVNKA